jgi:hypothetical protein
LNSNSIILELSRETAEQLYSFLYKSENKLSQNLIMLLDEMEKKHFSFYSIEDLEALTIEFKK